MKKTLIAGLVLALCGAPVAATAQEDWQTQQAQAAQMQWMLQQEVQQQQQEMQAANPGSTVYTQGEVIYQQQTPQEPLGGSLPPCYSCQ